eukprot:2545529-Amphidinium_carterae.1
MSQLQVRALAQCHVDNYLVSLLRMELERQRATAGGDGRNWLAQEWRLVRYRLVFNTCTSPRGLLHSTTPLTLCCPYSKVHPQRQKRCDAGQRPPIRNFVCEGDWPIGRAHGSDPVPMEEDWLMLQWAHALQSLSRLLPIFLAYLSLVHIPHHISNSAQQDDPDWNF